MKKLGIVLIVIGIAMIAVTGFNVVTRKKIVDVGPVHVTSDKNNPVQWSPILGGVILVAGIAAVVTTRGKR